MKKLKKWIERLREGLAEVVKYLEGAVSYSISVGGHIVAVGVNFEVRRS
jgi:hypothetical protein